MYRMLSFLFAIALTAMLGVTGVFATEGSIVVEGNGAHSDTDVLVADVSATVVGQTNHTEVFTLITANAQTGNVEVSKNTGHGSVAVVTGKASNTAMVSVSGSSNSADVANCGCDAGEPSVTVKNNGYKSDNLVAVLSGNLTAVGQNNQTAVFTGVGLSANTGSVKVNKNTGGSWFGPAYLVQTGKAKNTTVVNVTAPSNTVTVH